MKNFKVTINAKNGYRVRKYFVDKEGRKVDERMRFLYDGDNLVMEAYTMSYEDFLDNMEDNEEFGYLEVFETIHGNKYIYARDEEADEDYLIKVGK